MTRLGLPALVLALAVGACAQGSATKGPDLSTLPTCEEDVLGVRSKTLEDQGVSEVRHTIESLGWIQSLSGKAIVAVARGPTLVNNREVARALVDYYPTDLRDRGLGGSVTFFVWFDPDGNLVRRQIAEGARYLAIDQAAADVMSVMEFSPAATDTCRVQFWGDLVVTFEVQR